jgi:hypothetical protein
MQDPTHELKQVISSIVEPSSASIILDNIDKYFTLNSSIINPLLILLNPLEGKVSRLFIKL